MPAMTMWFSRPRIGTQVSPAARSARLRCRVSRGYVTCLCVGKLVGAGIAPCRVQDATGGGVQLDHATPQAISGLQFHVFIRNRSRGANVAYPKLLRGGKGGLSRLSRLSRDRGLEDAEDAEDYFCRGHVCGS